MKNFPAARRFAIFIISLMYILLFVYAAVSKLLDFENFQVQLGQSTLVGFLAGFVSYTVIIAELAIASLLVFPITRRFALYLGYTLMVLFTLYIYFILHYSSNIPCSCGGVIEKLTWDQHLLFNLAFVVLGGTALLLQPDRPKTTMIWLGSIITASTISIAALQFTSESVIHQHNNFTRRFPRAPLTRIGEIDLKYNSFYFAGQDSSQIYLGNHSAPLLVTGIDHGQNVKQYRIRFHDSITKFRAPHLLVSQSKFYLYDGTVPIIYGGNSGDWNVTRQMLLRKKFYSPVVINDSILAYRTFDRNKENILASTKLWGEPKYLLHSGLLEKQVDGVFDTDGMALYSEQLRQYIYLYYYRNQFIVTNPELRLIGRGKTIDTVAVAQLKVAYVKKRDERKLSTPALVVNRLSAIHKNLLFVQSALRGKHETEKMWRNANVVDVYDLRNNTYRMSFYLYKAYGADYDEFMVTDKHIYGIAGDKLIIHRIETALQKEFDVLDQP